MIKRNTIQRQLVMKAIRALSNHPTVEEVYKVIVKEYPDISKGTVYRNMKSMVNEGFLSRVSSPSGADRFEETLSKHYHLNCRRCGALVNVSIDYQSRLDFLAANMTNYKVDSHDIVFHGLCPSCQKILLGEDE